MHHNIQKYGTLLTTIPIMGSLCEPATPQSLLDGKIAQNGKTRPCYLPSTYLKLPNPTFL